MMSFGAFMATDKLFAIPIQAIKLDLEKELRELALRLKIHFQLGRRIC